MPTKYDDEKYAFGGYILDEEVRFNSTSGGAFSAIVDTFCDENYVVFGAAAKGLQVFHSFITDKDKLKRFRKSKYSQSIIGNSYKNVKKFLGQGKKVLFSGTPCQIAGLRKYLGSINQEKLLTVEVVCEGVPSPLYMKKYEKFLYDKYRMKVQSMDYRYTGKSVFANGKWDFQVMKINGISEQEVLGKKTRKKQIKMDRWFNPFWSVWLGHLMSRPSCYQCPFTTQERVADISLGDLWGIHLYCPELYGKNGGASLVVCNTDKGKEIFKAAQSRMFGHEVQFETALKYQSPMRKAIDGNLEYDNFMKDLRSDMDYVKINKKWAKKPKLKLLWQKYVWGNRQKIFLWNITRGKYRIR
ncbi:MAG: Coenzyme F420 hydrogenase/dehydrogenase, beta subunit C-terminal domain [Lachnospiraceae bacterium]|nr:Coenzyme F420 hydrogenase/dehydrogenase, beta subunit C-terminal domain [Lachnospiraceae bacterium]